MAPKTPKRVCAAWAADGMARALGETTPGETTPSETTFGETTFGETTLGEAAPGETTFCEAAVKLLSINTYPTSYFITCPERMRR